MFCRIWEEFPLTAKTKHTEQLCDAHMKMRSKTTSLLLTVKSLGQKNLNLKTGQRAIGAMLSEKSESLPHLPLPQSLFLLSKRWLHSESNWAQREKGWYMWRLGPQKILREGVRKCWWQHSWGWTFLLVIYSVLENKVRRSQFSSTELH